MDDLAMGSSVVAILTNIFLCFYEERWLNEFHVQFETKLVIQQIR